MIIPMHLCCYCKRTFPCPNKGECCGGELAQICADCFGPEMEEKIVHGLVYGRGERS